MCDYTLLVMNLPKKELIKVSKINAALFLYTQTTKFVQNNDSQYFFSDPTPDPELPEIFGQVEQDPVWHQVDQTGL